MNRNFTVDQANRTLPLVRRITRDIVEVYEILHRARARSQELKESASGTPSLKDDDELRKLEDENEARQERLESCLEELDRIGCQLKDFEKGLIDFPSEREGKKVLLCWKLGEEAVEFWHSEEGGFGGRQPVTG